MINPFMGTYVKPYACTSWQTVGKIEGERLVLLINAHSLHLNLIAGESMRSPATAIPMLGIAIHVNVTVLDP